MKPILEIKNLTKYYGKTLGVNNISFSLYEGDVFSFIGPNGAGKSTTIRCIMNLINKTSGNVSFLGEELKKDSVHMKEYIGYLPSEIHLYEDFTVKEMLDYHASFYKKDLASKRKELVKKLKVDESKKIEDLSFGNLKKLGIILAFMHEPKLLILDEPTSGLDPIAQRSFKELIEEEKKKGTTILYSTHVLGEVSSISNRVGIIKEGKLLNIEQVNQVMNNDFSFITIESEDKEAIIKDLQVSLIESTDELFKFKSSIPSNELIKKLSKYIIKKLYIEKPSLEEILLHYYE